MFVEHPPEVDALVNLRSQSWYFRIVVKILPDGQDAGEQQRGVDRGRFTLPAPFSRLRVHPVVEPAMLMPRFVCKELERFARALPCVVAADPIAVGCNAERRQAKAGCRNARNVLMIGIQK